MSQGFEMQGSDELPADHIRRDRRNGSLLLAWGTSVILLIVLRVVIDGTIRRLPENGQLACDVGLALISLTGPFALMHGTLLIWGQRAAKIVAAVELCCLMTLIVAIIGTATIKSPTVGGSVFGVIVILAFLAALFLWSKGGMQIKW